MLNLLTDCRNCTTTTGSDGNVTAPNRAIHQIKTYIPFFCNLRLAMCKVLQCTSREIEQKKARGEKDESMCENVFFMPMRITNKNGVQVLVHV